LMIGTPDSFLITGSPITGSTLDFRNEGRFCYLGTWEEDGDIQLTADLVGATNILLTSQFTNASMNQGAVITIPVESGVPVLIRLMPGNGDGDYSFSYVFVPTEETPSP